MNQQQAPSGRFSDQDIEATVRRNYTNDHGRYIALMDLSHFLSNDNVEALLPAAEVVLNRPLPEFPSRSLELDTMQRPAAPLPRMMKNLLKDRRRFQRQFVATTTPHHHQHQVPAEFDGETIANAHRSLENYQLKELFEREEQEEKFDSSLSEFASELLFATINQK